METFMKANSWKTKDMEQVCFEAGFHSHTS